MFLIMGMYDKSKEIEYHGAMQICPECGRYCSYKVILTYMCFSLFFIPLIKWGKKYFVTTSCCGKNYELDPGKGKQLERGENVIITEADLKRWE